MDSIKIARVRYEEFGGILSSESPPFLAWVDREYMTSLGYDNSPLWTDKRKNYLSAPTEVHFAVTNRCAQKCVGCYTNSTIEEKHTLSLEEIKSKLDLLNEMNIFHIAFGGGEAFERDDFHEIVLYCRRIGITPNLTTHGQSLKKEHLKTYKELGQVNISIDGIGKYYNINGRDGCFDIADSTIETLVDAGITVGINTVVSKKNFHRIVDVVKYAEKRGVNEVEFLKYKPYGRGSSGYNHFGLTQKMIRTFYPTVVKLSKKYSVELKIDCSFIPSMVYHKPPADDLDKLGVTGCDGGNTLLAVNGNGIFSGCSFVQNSEKMVNFKEQWDSSSHLNNFRSLEEKATEPCRSCEYLSICKTGCRAVAIDKTGSFFAPDPECPKVFDYNRKLSCYDET